MRRRVSEFVRCHQPRSIATRGLEVLAQSKLSIMNLILTYRAFIDAGISRHVLEGAVNWNVPASSPNDHTQLAFVVKGPRDLRRWTKEWLAVADIRSHRSKEYVRILKR